MCGAALFKCLVQGGYFLAHSFSKMPLEEKLVAIRINACTVQSNFTKICRCWFKFKVVKGKCRFSIYHGYNLEETHPALKPLT